MSEKVSQLLQQLIQVKKSAADQIQQNFYRFMLKAKDELGQASYHMAQFYYQYAHFILQKQQANLDLFNDTPLPGAQEQSQQQQDIHEDQQQGQEQEQNLSENVPKLDLKEQQLNKQPQNQTEQPQIAESEKQEKLDVEADQQQKSQTYDDKDICSMNLQLAINLYEQQLSKIRNGATQTNIDEVLNGLRRTRTRLGDLHLNDQNYAKCIENYQLVIDSQSKREGFESNRLISQLYYLIGNAHLYDNQQNCETKAIQEYIKAINILFNHLKTKLDYDISAFDIPTEEKTKVNRTHYMPVSGDSDSVTQIKNVITCLLDKIEDAHNQISMKLTYEEEKSKFKEESEPNKFGFIKKKPEVIHLGSFGNRIRKRMPQEEEQAELPFKENGVISKALISQKQQAKKPQE